MEVLGQFFGNVALVALKGLEFALQLLLILVFVGWWLFRRTLESFESYIKRSFVKAEPAQ